ncbi:MAG: rhodanese-like domain-containing protein [Candidatus Pelagibacter sp.]
MYIIFGFYKFKQLKKIKVLNKKLIKLIDIYNIKGTIIISSEGINGSISFLKKDLNKIKINIKKIFEISKFDNENSVLTKFVPFHKGRIKLKKEVVPIGKKLKHRVKNNHLSPDQWNKFILRKDSFVIDTRKEFEFKIGTFKNSINPKINNFRNFSKYFRKYKKNSKIGMFCTGGIRCEKASDYLKSKGYTNIFQLKGGIINYLSKIDKKKSLWKGECFVFDNRVSVNQNLKSGKYSICAGCREPISFKDKNSSKFEEGVSCPSCYDKSTESQKSRFRMRQSQIYKAKQSKKKYFFQKNV